MRITNKSVVPASGVIMAALSCDVRLAAIDPGRCDQKRVRSMRQDRSEAEL